VRSLHQQASQIRISLFTDMHLRRALSRVPPPRLQPKIAAHIAALAKTLHVFQCQQVVSRLRREKLFKIAHTMFGCD
jgi:hypothetical protein